MSLQHPSSSPSAPEPDALTPGERRPDWRNWVITILVIAVIVAIALIQIYLFSD